VRLRSDQGPERAAVEDLETSRLSQEVGLVAGRKEGLWMHYRLSKPTTKLYGMLIRAVCCCRSEFDEFGKDLQVLNKNKACLVGSLKCC
jgi:DNA-binding transcriptional ArsR family regulator